MQSLEKNLWGMLKRNLPLECDHQRIETGSTGRGIPDVNLCMLGEEIWVELKVITGQAVDLRPEQVAWHIKRTRAGGRTFIMARMKKDGVRTGKVDRIYVWTGEQAKEVKVQGAAAPGGKTFEAPYDWAAILAHLFQGATRPPETETQSHHHEQEATDTVGRL